MPDMREKVIEYIGELDNEIARCNSILENLHDANLIEEYTMRASVLTEVRNDLQSRLDELV